MPLDTLGKALVAWSDLMAGVGAERGGPALVWGVAGVGLEDDGSVRIVAAAERRDR